MEGFERERRPAPEHEPPVEPGTGSSLRGAALVASIIRGRELAGEAAGIPPLDSDQVLDLQRSAGNRLTHAALARWIDALPNDADIAQRLLEQLLTDPRARDVVAAALDALEPSIQIHVTGPGEPTDLEVIGPRAGAAYVVTPPATVELSFNALFGPAAAIGHDQGLTVTFGERTFRLPLPLGGAVGGVSANLR